VPDDGPGHPLFDRMRDVLAGRYGETFVRTSMALYRDGRDSVAWHGDTVARTMERALVATVSVGAARKFMLRPKGGGHSVAMQLGLGDLLVMGGTIQRTWQHAVPKVARADPRIVIMFRPAWPEE
jgi:alkylated DNA repair dioxygenase AlkB